MIKCAHCKDKHETVAEVRTCATQHGVGSQVKVLAAPPVAMTPRHGQNASDFCAGKL